MNIFDNILFRTGTWEYLGPKLMRMGSAAFFAMRNFILYTVHLIKSGWLNLED